MNKTQINKSRMFGSTDLVLDNHSSLFTMYVEMIAAHERLKEGLSLIAMFRQVQEAKTSGLTARKSLLKADVIKGILRFSGVLMAHATSTKNAELKVKARYVVSNLKKTPDPILFDIGILLLGLAEPILADLMKYSVNGAELTEMDLLLGQFKRAIPQQRVATSESKVSSLNIRDEINTLDKLLKEELDIFMLPFQFSEPDFYHAYKNARIIVNYLGRSKSKPDDPTIPNDTPTTEK